MHLLRVSMLNTVCGLIGIKQCQIQDSPRNIFINMCCWLFTGAGDTYSLSNHDNGLFSSAFIFYTRCGACKFLLCCSVQRFSISDVQQTVLLHLRVLCTSLMSGACFVTLVDSSSNNEKKYNIYLILHTNSQFLLQLQSPSQLVIITSFMTVILAL